MNTPSTASPQTTARLAGALWLIVIAVSVLAIVISPPVDPRSSPADVAAMVLAAETPFRLSFAAIFIGSLCYLGVTALIYELLHPVDRNVALFGALAGLVGIATGAASAVHQLDALALLRDATTRSATSAIQLQTLAQTFLRPGSEFSIGMVYFGCQIASIGYLILRSGMVPRIIGAVLVAGGLSYIISSFATFVAPAFGAVLSPFVIPIAILGEGSFTLWLLFKGVNAEWSKTI